MFKYPLISVVIAFISGILLHSLLNIKSDILFVLCSAFLVLTIIFYYLNKKNELRFFLTIMLSLNFVFIGSLYSSLSKVSDVGYPFEKQKIRNASIYGTITNIELLRKGRVTFTLGVDSLIYETKKIELQIQVLCNVNEEKDDKLNEIYNKLSVGNYVSLKGALQKGREQRNPGEFDYNKYLERKGILATLSSYKSSNLKVISSSSNYFSDLIFNTRKSIDESISKYHSHRTASLLRGLLLADRSKIDYDIKEQFINAGVIHVLAVSGLHVGFIILIFLFLFTRFNIYLRFILTIIGLLLFLVITGSPPSVFRASIMAIILIISFLTNRGYSSINSIALAAFILLLIDPVELFNPGFQLSFSAVLSIILVYPFFKTRIDGLKVKSNILKKLLLFISVSLSAQIGTLPFTLIYFHKFSLVAIFANVIVIPLIGIIVGIGIFTLFLTVVFPWLALVYASANNLFSDFLFFFVKIAGNMELSFLSIYQFSILDSLFFYLLIIMLFVSWNKFNSTRSKFILFVLIIMNFSLLISIDNKKLLPDNLLSIVLIDVGQGDGILIKFPNNETALIDAGNATKYFDTGERTIKPLLQYLEIDKINYGFVSHVDADHYAGYFSLIENGLVERIYKPVLDTSLKKDKRFEEFIKANEIPIENYSKGIMKIGNCRVYILNDTTDAVFNSLNVNDKSGILKIVLGNTSILFTGDAGIKTEKIVIDDFGEFLKSDALKLGHHGSKTSSSKEFLKYVNAKYGLISAGVENRFNHPHDEIVKRLKSRNIEVKRTDVEGAVILKSDGGKIEFIDWRNNLN